MSDGKFSKETIRLKITDSNDNNIQKAEVVLSGLVGNEKYIHIFDNKTNENG